MKSSSLFTLTPLAALVSAMPQVQHANVTARHPLTEQAHHKGLRARQTPESPQTYAGFAGVDWNNGYDNNYAVSGQIIVPSLTWRSDGPATQTLAIWVGIGGTHCSTTANELAQTGLVGYVHSDGSMTWTPFYEWALAYDPVYDTSFAVSAGDTVYMQIVLNSPTSATANVENRSTGQTWSSEFSGPEVCASDAQWIIEDYCYNDNVSNCSLAEFAEFYMTDALVIANDEYINASAGSELTMSRNGQDYVHVGDSTSNIIFQYVGPN